MYMYVYIYIYIHKRPGRENLIMEVPEEGQAGPPALQGVLSLS